MDKELIKEVLNIMFHISWVTFYDNHQEWSQEAMDVVLKQFEPFIKEHCSPDNCVYRECVRQHQED